MKALVVCPTYGRIPYLGRMLASFLSQDYDDKELVIINDDKNVELCCDYKNVRVINYGARLTVAHKRNIGVSIGNHDIIFPMDDDDIFLSNRMSNHISKYGNITAYRNSACYVIYGNQFITGGSSPNAVSYLKKSWLKIGGYKMLDDIRADDTHLYFELRDNGGLHEVNDADDIDFVYHFGGVNYHLSSTPQENIEKIAYQQLQRMDLVGEKYWIEPNYHQLKKITDLVDLFKTNKENIKIIHEGDCEFTVDIGK